VIRLLKERGADDIIVFGGGVIPDDDVPILKEMGVKAVFGPGTPTSEIIEWLQSAVQERRSRERV